MKSHHVIGLAAHGGWEVAMARFGNRVDHIGENGREE